MLDDRLWSFVDDAVARFEETSVATRELDLREFLPETSSTYRRTILQQLVVLDLERRWQADQHPMLEEYLESYPELQENAETTVELLRAEIRIRRSFGDIPNEEELHRRFPNIADRIETLSTDTGHSGTSDTPSLSANDDAHSNAAASRSQPMSFGSKEHPERYEVRKLLGKGGMGEVYRAYDTKLQREVAIKVPRFNASLDPEVAMRFVREMRATAALRHPNICPVYDADMAEGHYFIVMALISGRDLESRLLRETLSIEETVRLVAKIARALDAAHQTGVVHRDIKPGNILLDEKGEPLLTDFGLCRQLRDDGSRLLPSAILGTPAYMAPEQAEMEPTDRASNCQMLCSWFLNQAAICSCMMPSLKERPSMTNVIFS